MPYWENVTRSFRIAWRHKYLWLLALFAGEGGGYTSFNFSQGSPSAPPNTGAGAPNFTALQEQIATWISDHVALLVTIGVVWLLLAIVFFFLGAVCEGATVRATAEHDADRPFGLGWAWRSGVTTMWVIVRFRLLLFLIALPLLILFAAFAIAVVVAFVNRNGGAAAPLFGFGALLGIVTIPYVVYVLFLDKLGSRAVILEQIGARAGIARAHRLLFKRLGRSLLVWLLGIAVGIGLGVAVACVLAVALVPLVIVGAVVAYANTSAIIPLLVLGVVVVLPLSLVVEGFVAAQTATYWTLAFRRLDLEYPPAPAYPYQPAPPPAAAQ